MKKRGKNKECQAHSIRHLHSTLDWEQASVSCRWYDFVTPFGPSVQQPSACLPWLHLGTDSHSSELTWFWWWWSITEREYIHAATACSLCLSDHNRQVDFFWSLMVRAGYLCVVIIHQTLTWTTGALSCTQMLMHGIAQGGVQTLKKSLHWKLTLGRKSFAAPGNRTCVSGVPVRCSNQLNYIPSQRLLFTS